MDEHERHRRALMITTVIAIVLTISETSYLTPGFVQGITIKGPVLWSCLLVAESYFLAMVWIQGTRKGAHVETHWKKSIWFYNPWSHRARPNDEVIGGALEMWMKKAFPLWFGLIGLIVIGFAGLK